MRLMEKERELAYLNNRQEREMEKLREVPHKIDPKFSKKKASEFEKKEPRVEKTKKIQDFEHKIDGIEKSINELKDNLIQREKNSKTTKNGENQKRVESYDSHKNGHASEQVQ